MLKDTDSFNQWRRPNLMQGCTKLRESNLRVTQKYYETCRIRGTRCAAFLLNRQPDGIECRQSLCGSEVTWEIKKLVVCDAVPHR